MAKTSLRIKAKREPKFGEDPTTAVEMCGRPRGYLRRFGICRICVRKLASEGLLPGVIKSSW